MDAEYVRVSSRRFRRVAARFGLSPPDIDDAVQVTLLQIWLGDPRVYPTNRAAWEDQVAANRARNLLRREHRRREELMPFDEENGIRDDSADPEARAIGRRRIKILVDLIAQIDPGRRDLFIKHELQGVPLHDLAIEEGISLDAAKKRLARAWEELESARDRWQAEQRRKRHDTTPAILPFGLLEARSRFTDAWRALPPRLRFFPIVGGLAVLAACLVPMPSSMRAGADVMPALATVSPPPSPPASPPSSPAPKPEPSPPLRFSRVEGATGMTALQRALPKSAAPPKPSPPPASATADVPLPYTATEESMITQAQVLIDACLLAEALAELADHERAFPDGYFANRREALRKKAKTTRDCERKAVRRSR